MYVLCSCLLSTTLLADWTLFRHNGRDYVDVTELATFYHLKEGTIEGKKRQFTGQDSLVIEKDSRAIRLNGITHWLSFPIIQNGDRWLISRMDLGKTIDPALRPTSISNFQPVKTIVLDAGHGGHDRGAFSPSAWEKDFTLDMVRRIRQHLIKAGLRVIMTRDKDKTLPLESRAAMANRTRQSLFVSIHFNSAKSNPLANGFEIFCITPRGSPSTEYDNLRTRDMVEEKGNPNDLQSFVLANTIYHSLLGHLDMGDRGVKRARFAVLRLTQTPAVLIEGGFLTNADDLRNVTSRSWRDRYASAIAQGILEYKSLAENHKTPRNVAQYRTKEVPDVLSVKEIPTE